MTSAFWISATFLTGRYHGEEWPPSPARILQALAAGVKNGGNRILWPRVEEGLRWLERLPAPRIFARSALRTARYRLAVPNNDMDVVAKEWVAGRSASVSAIRTMKPVAPRMISEAATPHVCYVWDLDDPETGQRMAALLTPAAHCLYSLGWGVDMAYADSGFSAMPRDGALEEWVPSATGERKAVPIPGFVEDLESTYRRFTARALGSGVDTDTRLRVYGLKHYKRRGERVAPWTAFSLRALEEKEGRFSRPWRDVMEVAAWMRHAAGKTLERSVDWGEIGEDFGSFVMGHSDDRSGASRRLSYLPLPSIHPQHGDGRIRRVMVAGPLDSEIGRKLVDQLALRWLGVELVSDDGRQRCVLDEVDEQVVDLYTQSARLWRSVTPVVLHGFNATKGVVSVGKTESMLFRAFEMAGRRRDEIESMAFQAAPLWNGADAANRAKVPAHLNGYPRYHVQVRFQKDVRGPVLAGIGRHYGLGLFGARRE